MDDGVPVRSQTEYESIVAERLTDREYERIDGAPEGYDAVAYHRRSASILPPGSLEQVVVVAGFASPAPRTVRTFSRRAFAFGRDHERTRSRWLGGIPAVYAVAACETPDTDLKRWVTEYSRRHRRAFEFPVVVDLPAETVHYFADTPLVGGRAYEGFRKTAAEVLDPSKASADLEDL